MTTKNNTNEKKVKKDFILFGGRNKRSESMRERTNERQVKECLWTLMEDDEEEATF